MPVGVTSALSDRILSGIRQVPLHRIGSRLLWDALRAGIGLDEHGAHTRTVFLLTTWTATMSSRLCPGGKARSEPLRQRSS